MAAGKCPRCGADMPVPIPSTRPGRPPKWCSQTCRRAAYEERRAAANGAIAVRVETVEKPVERVVERVRVKVVEQKVTPRKAAQITLESPAASQAFLSGLADAIASGELDRHRYAEALDAAKTLMLAMRLKRLIL